MKLIVLYIITFLLFTITAFSRVNDPPVVTCIEVHETGEVTIYWQSLDLSALEFRIFFSTDEINWTQAGSVDTQNQSLSFVHTLARADTAIYYYYITAIYPTIEESSGVFRTIFLDVVNATTGVAALFWNSVSTPLPEGSSTYYKIYKSIYEIGLPNTWNLVDSTENTSYIYVIEDGICNDSINFKIEIDNINACSSVSNVAGDWFTEDIQPEAPVFDSVSIINNDSVILGWKPSISTDVVGTIIYRWENIAGTNKWINIDTVYNDSSYIVTNSLPCDTNYLYAIAALPTCGLPSPKTETTAQRPILLYNAQTNLCSRTNFLSWEHYINALQPFDSYEIWTSVNGNTFTKVADVPSTENFYNHINIEYATNYDYFVRAVFGELNFTSTSCTKSIQTGDLIVPDSIYLANATVLPDNSIELTLDVDLKPQNCTWQINRSDAGGGTPFLLISLSRNEITTSPYTYLDETADGSTGFYNYSVNVFDSCGTLVLESNTIKTIYLQGNQLNDADIYLSWNSFEGFDGDLDKYYIFRMLDDITPSQPIDSTDAQTNEYTDDISSVEASVTKFSYWVQASEKNLNTYGYKEKSNSNIISMFREINFYFPNAFRPGGINNIFKPVSTGFGGSNYLFQIYNRWGQLIFESTDYSKGWDGNYKESAAPQGTYIYRLVYDNVFGKTMQQKGVVTLIK